MAHLLVVERPKGDKANNEPLFWAVLLCVAFHLVRALATGVTTTKSMVRPATREQNPELFRLVVFGDSIVILLLLSILVHGRWFK